MDKRLISTLIRVVNSLDADFPASAGLRQFGQIYGLGMARGQTRVAFSASDKEEIRAILLAQEGINAATTASGAWADVTRAQALDLGNNEKLAGGAVKRNRISVKPLPGRALHLNGERNKLFPTAHLDVDWQRLTVIGHDQVLLVENYECFNAIDEISAIEGLGSDLATGPLVVYRGDRHESRLDNVKRFLAASGLPVILFGDWDPASLVEAAGFENAIGLVRPQALEAMIAAHGNAELYRRQMGPAFDRLADDAREAIRNVHAALYAARKGLVQEVLIGRVIPLRFDPF